MTFSWQNVRLRIKQRPRLTVVLLSFFIIVISGMTWIAIAQEKGYFDPSISDPYNITIANVDDNDIRLQINLDVCNPNSITVPAYVNGDVLFFETEIGNVGILGDNNIYGRDMTTLALILAIENEKLWDPLLNYLQNSEVGLLDINADIGLVFEYDVLLRKESTKTLNVTTKTCSIKMQSHLLEIIEEQISAIQIKIGGITLFSVESIESLWLDSPIADLTLATDVEATYCRFIPLFDRGAIKIDGINIADFSINHTYPPLHSKNIYFSIKTTVDKTGLITWLQERVSHSDAINLSVIIEWDAFFGRPFTTTLYENIERGGFSNLFEFSPCEFQEEDLPDVTNHDEVISLLILLWISYLILLITIYFKKIKGGSNNLK